MAERPRGVDRTRGHSGRLRRHGRAIRPPRGALAGSGAARRLPHPGGPPAHRPRARRLVRRLRAQLPRARSPGPVGDLGAPRLPPPDARRLPAHRPAPQSDGARPSPGRPSTATSTCSRPLTSSSASPPRRQPHQPPDQDPEALVGRHRPGAVPGRHRPAERPTSSTTSAPGAMQGWTAPTSSTGARRPARRWTW